MIVVKEMTAAEAVTNRGRLERKIILETPKEGEIVLATTKWGGRRLVRETVLATTKTRVWGNKR